METPMAILSAKLFIPPRRAMLVPRPRLVERLTQGLQGPLTLISAPAGFGKTTLVSEWRASDAGRDIKLAWLSLDDEDNDPARFLAYLAAALGALNADLAEMASEALQSLHPPAMQIFLTNLVNQLGELPAPFALALDDYHVITAPQVHEAVAFLLDHLPPQMHIILLTRADPPLSLARLRARNQLAEIRAADLRFTSCEATAFLNQVMSLALSAGDVTALEQRTEGWIAGLQLAALAIQTLEGVRPAGDVSDFITAFTGSHHYIAEFLLAEVLIRQPETIRSFLLQISILERMTGDLCDQLTGRSDGQALLQQLDKANLFLIPLDGEHRWYRFHHLFAEMLRNLLQKTDPSCIPELHQRAAEWYEQQGFVSDAIRHRLAAGNQADAVRLIEQNAMAILLRGDSVTVLNWIASVEPLDFEMVYLGRLDIQMCRGCRFCFDRGEAHCPLKDDFLSFKARLKEADAVIAATPVYTDDVSGIVKNWLDRMAHACHRPEFAGQSLYLLATMGGTSSRRALKTLRVLNYMGFHVIGRAGLTTGALSSLEEIEARYGAKIEQIARSIFRDVQRRASLRPSIFMLALFRVEQMIWRNEKADSVSRRYWEEKGWLDSRRTFFVGQSASLLKVALARLLTAAITLFRVGY
jgi:NAD(P)H-dependent FMN reductase